MATDKKRRKGPAKASSTPKSQDKRDGASGATASTASTPAALAPTHPAPPILEGGRDAVTSAVYAEAIARGMSSREAHSLAEEVADRLRLGGETSSSERDRALFDLRAEQDFKYPGGKRVTKMHGGGSAPVMRDPSTIDTIVIHQTAVEFGVSRRAVKLADGDVDLARARRALDVACHALAFRDGFFAVAHPLRAYVNHAGRFNAPSLGLEIEGRYPGLCDDVATMAREDLDTTWGGPPSELTEETVASARAALRWLVEEGRAEGMPISKIVSHRQSSDNRRSDPGEEIWRRVVLDFAVAELGLTAFVGSPWNKGRPVPIQWDPENGIGNY